MKGKQHKHKLTCEDEIIYKRNNIMRKEDHETDIQKCI